MAGESGPPRQRRCHSGAPTDGIPPEQDPGTNYHHSCIVLSSDGSVWCVGSNYGGRLGNGTTQDSRTLVATGLGDVAALSLGSNSTCALLGSGGVKCWGDNQHGQLGLGVAGQSRSSPTTEVVGLTDVVELHSGNDVTCARKGDDSLWCWGRNDRGQLGAGPSSGRPVPIGLNVTSFAVGFSHVCAVIKDFRVVCWGENAKGQLGDGSTTDRAVPAFVLDSTGGGQLSGIDSLALGYEHSCALGKDRRALCWGSNLVGQLGVGAASGAPLDSTPRTHPVAVTGGLTFDRLVAGYAHTCGSSRGGQVYCWGSHLNIGNDAAGPDVFEPRKIDVF